MSAAEAAKRLGVRIEECDRCACTCLRADGLFLGVWGDTPYRHIGNIFLCSMTCLLAACDERPEYVGRQLRAHRWHSFLEKWAIIGERDVCKDWVWTDTGNALWIEANAAKLRVAGEIR
jgi:hypothetical protein